MTNADTSPLLFLPPDTETGPGVFETALAYTNVLRVADNAILFKLLAKTVGMQYSITPSFMAKPYGEVSRPKKTFMYHGP